MVLTKQRFGQKTPKTTSTTAKNKKTPRTCHVPRRFPQVFAYLFNAGALRNLVNAVF
jgi:hypothetical protein